MASAPELLVGKDFHIFVSYSSEDEDIMNIVVESLECAGVVCCVHGRDFLPGSDIISNINRSVDKSMYVLLLLSEQYSASPFCEFETSVALHSKLRNEVNIIPVMMEPCVIPESLRHITYIDARDGNYRQLHVKIIDKIMKRERTRAEETIPNGKGIPLPFTESRTEKRVSISNNVRDTVAAHQIEVSEDWWHILEMTLNSTTAIRFRKTVDRYEKTSNILAACGFGVAFASAFASLIFLPNGPDRGTTTGSLICWIFSGLMVIVLFTEAFCRSCTRRRRKTFHLKAVRHLQSLLWTRISQHFFWRKHFLFIYHDDVLRVAQYNAEPCVSYFSRRIKDSDNLKAIVRQNENHEECTRRLFNRFLKFYSYELVVPDYNRVRHPTANSSACLCFLVQEWLGEKPRSLTGFVPID